MSSLQLFLGTDTSAFFELDLGGSGGGGGGGTTTTSISPSVLFAFPNLSDVSDFYTPTITGGSWQAGAPLANLQNPFLAYKTRSTDTATASTQFTVDLGTLQLIQVVALPNTNLSINASVTINLYSDAAKLDLVATKTIVPFPQIYTWGALPWGSPFLWTGQEFTPQQAAIYDVVAFAIFDTSELCQFVEVLITDTGNADAFVELSRIFIAPGWQPSINFAPGAQIGVNDLTVITRTLGGAKIADKRPRARTFVANIENLDLNEAFAEAFDMQMSLGISDQFFFSYAPTDAANLHRSSFIATANRLNPLVAVAYAFQGISFDIEEVVA
jgi:hypothetical protein